MEMHDLFRLGGLLVSSFTIAFAALWLLARSVGTGKSDSIFTDFAQDQDCETYLFDGETLVDATADDLAETPQSDWRRFLTRYENSFDNLKQTLAELPDRKRIRMLSRDGNIQLTAEWKFGLARISVSGAAGQKKPLMVDQADYSAMEQELQTLRETARAAPFLIWCQRADRSITWANNAYLELARKCAPHPDAPPWPPARIFDVENTQPGSKPPASRRIRAHIDGEPECRWFECFEAPLDGECLFMAVSADTVVKAEAAMHDFVQTLSKTFAHLTVGLAIFDKHRCLKLFNPALMDLTSLPADFLSARPTLHSFLDRLREKNMLPEPKDYKSWRQRFQELETAAVDGTYEETWSLADGSTYRVVGRPHPDGAVAFLIEDISAEISLTRRFRAELETGQAVIDSLDEAIAVFAPGGALTLSNLAYDKLWGMRDTSPVANLGILDATRLWSERCAPSPVWADAREFLSAPGARSEWFAEVRLLDGRMLSCRFKPIAGGSTMASFRLEKPTGQHLRDRAPARALLGVEPASL